MTDTQAGKKHKYIIPFAHQLSAWLGNAQKRWRQSKEVTALPGNPPI